MKCPQCGGEKLLSDHTRGEIICSDCGYVVKDKKVDLGPEWRAFNSQEKDAKSRVGSPIVHPGLYTLSTEIDRRSRDAHGRYIGMRRKIQMQRLDKWQRRSRVASSKERNLIRASLWLRRLSWRLGLPRSVTGRALMIYRRALERGMTRGRSISAVAAASLYAACRILKTPRKLKQIARFTRSSRKDISRCYRLLLRKGVTKTPLPDPKNHVSRIAETLKLKGTTVRRAIKILTKAKDSRLTAGKSPSGLAGAAVYIASLLCGDPRTQKEIARAAQVTEVTIRNVYKNLVESLKIRIPMK